MREDVASTATLMPDFGLQAIWGDAKRNESRLAAEQRVGHPHYLIRPGTVYEAFRSQASWPVAAGLLSPLPGMAFADVQYETHERLP